MVIPDSTTNTKCCTKCKREFPETPEFFAPSKAYRNGLNSQCRECVLVRRREREGWTKERKRSPKAREGYVYCTRCKQELPASTNFFTADVRYKSGFKSTCHACHTFYANEWRANHREKYLDKKREWRKANPEKVKRHKSASQKRNRASANARSHRYNLLHPDKLRERTRIGQHRRRHADGKFTRADIDLQIKTQTDKRGVLRCWWCGEPIKDEYHIDHRIAVNRGGSNNPENLCIACPPCNRSKQDKLPHEWSDRLL